jgi:tripartite-type tricarboxylate transporter receptor subunit TctC
MTLSSNKTLSWNLSRRRTLAGLAAAAAAPGSALAQSAPLKIVFPFAAGGTGDALCRFLAERLGQALNRPAIVENRTGADGRIGIQSVKAAAADGATLLVTTGPTMALMPQLHKAPGYDPVADFEPVSQLARFEFCIVAANVTPAKTIAELLAWAKANPDKATYAVPGLGTIPHFAGVALGKLIDTDLRRLAYRGGSPAMNDLVAGQVPMGVMTLSDALQQHRAGTVRIVAVVSAARSPFLSDIPTLTEAGYPIAGDAWYGLWAPKGTASATIATLNAAVVAALTAPDVKERFLNFGLIPTGSSAADLEVARKAMADVWAPTIKASGFTMEQ